MHPELLKIIEDCNKQVLNHYNTESEKQEWYRIKYMAMRTIREIRELEKLNLKNRLN